jgi:hypothetical protein
MMADRLTPAAVRELTRARSAAGSHWCVPHISKSAIAFVWECQRRHYTPGSDGVDTWPLPGLFEAAGAVGVSLLRRRELPLPELARALKPLDDPQSWAHRAKLERGLAASPFVFLPEDDAEPSWVDARTRAAAFLGWLARPTAPGDLNPVPQE